MNSPVVPKIVAPRLAASSSLPSFSAASGPGIPMDQDAPMGPNRKRSFEVVDVLVPPSSKLAKARMSSQVRRGGSIASSSSSRLRPDAHSTAPSSPMLLSVPFPEEDGVLMRLDALETSVRRGDTDGALRRIDEVRQAYRSRMGRNA